jgi:hypothetical protein
MKKLGLYFTVSALMLGIYSHASAVEVQFHGDLNNRFQFTNHADFLTLDSTSDHPELNDGDVDENFGEIKYRLWAEANSNDGDVKGVIATEIGGLRFGEHDKADFSGDDIQFEVRWAFVDVQMPWVERTARFKIGLQPFTVNKYQWQETSAGVAFNSTIGNDMDYVLAWMRGAEYDKTARDSDDNDDRTDLDAFLVRLNLKPGGIKTGLFVNYQGYDSDGNGSTLDSRDWEVKLFKKAGDPDVDFDLWSFGTDGIVELNPFFINWDLIYQTGEFNDLAFTEFASGETTTGNFDMSAYFIHFDVGATMNNLKITYTFWYASGDDNPNDDDFDAFIATDVDITDSIVLFEGNYADDNYFTERPYLADKGFIMNRLGIDYKTTEKMTLGGALMYMMTAEDFEYTAAANGDTVSEDELGWEIDVYIQYMLYPNVEIAFNFGYLFAGDALDVYEVAEIQDGSSDEDIYIASARLRYQF